MTATRNQVAEVQPNDIFPPRNPLIEVWDEAPPPQLMGFPERRGRLDPKNLVLRQKCQWAGWLPGALLGVWGGLGELHVRGLREDSENKVLRQVSQ